MTLCLFFAIIGIVVSVLAVGFIALMLSQITLDDDIKWRKK